MRKLEITRMRLGIWLVCLGFIFALATPAGAVPAVSKAYPQYLYTIDVYSGPDAGAAVIGRLENGAAVTVTEETGDYFQVDCRGTTGYIPKALLELRGEEYYVNCSEDIQEENLIHFRTAGELEDLRAALLSLAEAQLGTPYVYGGSAPGGFDCSGFVYYLYGQQGYALERGASSQMATGLIVDSDQLEVGDLVFFRDHGSGYLASHVGIYTGDGQMLHAGSGGISYARLDGDWYAQRFVGARRVVLRDPADTYPDLKTALQGRLFS